jgi:hypothetical protein
LTSSKHICLRSAWKDAKSPKAPNIPLGPRARLTAIPKTRSSKHDEFLKRDRREVSSPRTSPLSLKPSQPPAAPVRHRTKPTENQNTPKPQKKSPGASAQPTTPPTSLFLPMQLSYSRKPVNRLHHQSNPIPKGIGQTTEPFPPRLSAGGRVDRQARMTEAQPHPQDAVAVGSCRIGNLDFAVKQFFELFITKRPRASLAASESRSPPSRRGLPPRRAAVSPRLRGIGRTRARNPPPSRKPGQPCLQAHGAQGNKHLTPFRFPGRR